ncbi:GNAT family N-acetyltransferase [Actinoplanes friuliensis]|uniref:N-acetyltransferase GCN5 n=1 Tax=Actinoplanes friuliensis DSM 7358 TaxID=1246995 RepID=U5W3A5_9ACTN|nr:GNAT family protein [Actinoplanes friuliensis]AGZ43688.1 N-acetyltransferase GCN5 [Actinoplanes friuliensis DSM 7358]
MLITTERLVLRRFRAGDAETLAAYRSSPDVALYQSWDAPYPLERARYAIESMAEADPAQPGWFQYAIETKAGKTHIGDVGVNLNDNLLQAEIGYTVAPEHQGNGYATEAVRAVLNHLFRVQGLHKVAAECDARNEASARLLERVGFTREGHLRQHTWIKNEWTDDLLYGLLEVDFFGLDTVS